MSSTSTLTIPVLENSGLTPLTPLTVLNANAPKIGLANLPYQEENTCKRKTARFSLMLAGVPGTGKSTFLNTLFGDSLVTKQPWTADSVVRERHFELTENGYRMHLTAVDMPGFGAKMDNQFSWVPLVRYIDHNFKMYLLQEEQPNRSQLRDNRVHICLFFIQPTSTELCSLDIHSMKEISKRVNLIPLVARSDTLNKNELARFKQLINETLEKNDIRVCQFVSDNYVLDKIKCFAPFAVIGSNQYFKNNKGDLVRARRYGWGMVEVDNPDHCDFVHLRDILMAEHLLDLMASTDSHYNQYRQQCLTRRIEAASSGIAFQEIRTSDTASPLEDGMQSYMIYQPVRAPDTLALIDNYGPEEQKIEEQTRKHFEFQIREEERRFRQWKTDLLAKQKIYNDDLEDDHQRLMQLEREIREFGPHTDKILRDLEFLPASTWSVAESIGQSVTE